MTLISTHGFDTISAVTNEWTGASNNLFLSTTIKRTGRASMMFQAYNGDQYIVRTIPQEHRHATLIIGFAYLRETNGSGSSQRVIFRGDANVTNHVDFLLTSGGSIDAYRGLGTSGGTLLGSTGSRLSLNTWAYVELRVVLHDTTGEVQAWVNGVRYLNITGVDTKNGGTGTLIDGLYLGAASNDAGNRYMDDMYIANGAGVAPWNAPVGDIQVKTIVPTGPGTYTQLTPTGVAANWDNVNEAPIVTTDYNSGTTNALRDTYAMEDVTPTTGTVLAVNVKPYIQGPSGIAPVIRMGTTDYVGATLAGPAGSFTLQNQIYELDPAGAAWTPASVNAAEFGVQTVV